MRVCIFGTGYVGLVTGTCLADVGHDVVCVDIDAGKVERLNAGIPDFEPGLTPMVQANHAAGRLRFTTDAAVLRMEMWCLLQWALRPTKMAVRI